MPNAGYVQVLGLKELEKKMIELGPKIGRKALKGALVAGGKIIKKEAQLLSPDRTGRLDKAMYIKTMSKPNPFKENVIFGVRHGRKMSKRNLDAFYWTFLEFGHLVRGKKYRTRGERLSAASDGTKRIEGIHFVENAFKRKQLAALNKITETLSQKISQLVRES